jgi:hypothetical protein
MWAVNWNGSSYDIWLDAVKKTTSFTTIVGSPPTGKMQTNIRLARRKGAADTQYGDYDQDQIGLFSRPLVQSEFDELYNGGAGA